MYMRIVAYVSGVRLGVIRNNHTIIYHCLPFQRQHSFGLLQSTYEEGCKLETHLSVHVIRIIFAYQISLLRRPDRTEEVKLRRIPMANRTALVGSTSQPDKSRRSSS